MRPDNGLKMSEPKGSFGQFREALDDFGGLGNGENQVLVVETEVVENQAADSTRQDGRKELP